MVVFFLIFNYFHHRKKITDRSKHIKHCLHKYKFYNIQNWSNSTLGYMFVYVLCLYWSIQCKT